MRASSSDDGITGSSLSEIAALDQLIDLLKGANGQDALTRLVAENLLAFDRQFWIRLATRSDGAQSKAEREQLTNLANVWGFPVACMRMQYAHAPVMHVPSVVWGAASICIALWESSMLRYACSDTLLAFSIQGPACAFGTLTALCCTTATRGRLSCAMCMLLGLQCASILSPMCCRVKIGLCVVRGRQSAPSVAPLLLNADHALPVRRR